MNYQLQYIGSVYVRDYQDYKSKVNDNLNAADIGALINALFGKSVVEEWMEEGMSLPQLNDVLSHMLKVYGLDGSSSDADPKVMTQQTDTSSEKPNKKIL